MEIPSDLLKHNFEQQLGIRAILFVECKIILRRNAWIIALITLHIPYYLKMKMWGVISVFASIA